ncbi:MAG: 1-acyl-sn-glycerol-3-phosphate acyltransferase [Myxococcales bacterium]|jgi:1-acyl-sn-glycerol-3-phosphate acyltransferase|nr:1-acyl-sn-glycerol-3-phosphate acyltransferase [Myxococcales bacterium]
MTSPLADSTARSTATRSSESLSPDGLSTGALSADSNADSNASGAPLGAPSASIRALSACRLGPLGLAIYNVLYWPYLLGSCVLLFAPASLLWLLTAPWDPKRRWLGAFTRWWGRHYLGWAPYAGLRVTGAEHLASVEQAVYVSNHLSMVDILALYALPRPFLWVSKIENFYVPFLGWNMWLNRYVPLRRGYLPSIMRMYRTCVRRLGEGFSLCLFPEGTRSETGRMRPFYPGAFRLALRAGVPVVPLVLEGSDRVLPKKRLQIAPQPVTLRVLPPVTPEEVGHDWRRLRDEVRRRMERAQAELHG